MAATIAATLGLRVEQHDDGSRPGMHDLNIMTSGGGPAAVEVTAAADPDSIQLWKLVNGRDERWTVASLQGGWMLHLEPTARAKRLLIELPAFLQELEGKGITEIPSQRRRHEVHESIEGRARVLGIVSGNQSGTDFPGSIYLTIELSPERTGGVVDSTGSAVPDWVRDFCWTHTRATSWISWHAAARVNYTRSSWSPASRLRHLASSTCSGETKTT